MAQTLLNTVSMLAGLFGGIRDGADSKVFADGIVFLAIYSANWRLRDVSWSDHNRTPEPVNDGADDLPSVRMNPGGLSWDEDENEESD